ncbi:Alpha-amylase A type-like protein [Hapsidospora chrysogenum ATCC 11550]|uniref:Alpha-amylase n=1 Tax=Hapsidospora chrysogenum (strain ATCC 11550 / CBS 779.69 / DSM 880 / IAM 14645 / JCM 23072 / IMI 49137) TaxID=857340 RepID=A0A086SYF2_HAPC1|nr:Alpha-amylase A type-like protein [Hapsidospora chrysogenum ATCC 11550]
MKSATTLLASALQLSSLALAADKAAWKSRNIYFALTDRIARSSDDSGGDACSSLGSYCGGTFAGLQSKLDYIQGMGFDAIWITPVVANTEGGYHGYWAKDLYSVNENYGTAEELKSLVNAAHEKGIYMMVDVVANHMGEGDVSNYKPEPLNQQGSYHSSCEIDYNDQESVEVCEIANLPDLKTEDSSIRSVLQEWVGWLIKEYGFDGVRIDTVKHVEKDFWPDFAAATGVYTIGEVFEGDPDYLAGYDGLMGGLLNYAVYYPMNRFYQQKGSSQDLVNMIDTVSESFADPAALGTFLDNHDNARWLHAEPDTTLFKNALAFVILSRGIPIVYYGSEQGYGGGEDPANREDLWRSGFNTDADLYKFIAALSGARSGAGGLGGNDHVHLYTADTAYAWSRAGGDLIVLTTNGGEGSGGEHCFNAQVKNGSWDIVVGGQGSVSSDGEGNVCLRVENGLPVVLSASG